MEASALTVDTTRLQLVQHFDVATVALLAYDYLLTLPLEVKHIWPAPWNVGKVLFYLTRYLPFMDMSLVMYYQFSTSPTRISCEIAYKWSGWSFILGIAIADVILAMRTWAIWGSTRNWALLLSVSFLCIWIPIPVIMAHYLSSLQFSSMPESSMSGCFVVGSSNIFSVCYALLMAYEFLIFILTCIKAVYHDRNPFACTLFVDGLTFSTYLFLISLLNVVILLRMPSEFVNLFSAFQRVMHSILSARMLLRLREAAGCQHSEFELITVGSQPRSPNQARFEST